MRKTFFNEYVCRSWCRAAWTIFLLLSFTVLWANPMQQKLLTGTVVSELDREPLIGVSVLIKGTTNGTITNLDGEYSIQVNNGDALVFSYVGYLPKEIVYNGQSSLNVELKEDTKSLDEVVVVGYGVQKKKLVTGATVQVKGDNIAKMNTSSPLQALQGQTPGVNIASTSGQPGSDMKVTIRGLGTVGNSQPLYLIDGIGGDISTLNPADIESIDILKDAASSAIYGAQAANGVVLITTKQGKAGKAMVTFDGYFGIQRKAHTVDMLNANEYMTIMDEQALNSGNGAYNWNSLNSIWRTNANGEREVINTDWVNTMIKDNAQTQSYSLGVTGGSETSSYAISLGYFSQEGLIGGKDASNYERYNARVNSEHQLFNNFLRIGQHASFVYKKNKGVDVGNQYSNTLRSSFGTSPLSPIYSDNNIYDSPYNDTTNSDWYSADGNPYGAMMTKKQNENKNRTFSGDIYAQIEPIKNLRIRTVFGLVYNSSEYRNLEPLYQFSIYDFNNTRTSVTQNMGNSTTWTWTNTASYDFEVGSNNFNVLLGTEASSFTGSYLSAQSGGLKQGFDDWNHAWIDNTTSTGNSDGLYANGKPYDVNRTISYFGRIGWNYKERYMATATMRIDGSSRFASGNRFGYFPSVSAGWVLSNEAFMEDASWTDFLKLRISWGRVGNQNIDNFQYLSPIKFDNTYYLFGTDLGADAQANYWGAYPNRLGNSNLKWETSEQTNIGIDARFINGHLGVNMDYYIKKTKDWLVVAPILATAGAGAPYINGGDVKNTGFELGLDWNDNIGRNFMYNIGFNAAYNKNKVGNIPTSDGIIHGLSNQLYDNSPEFYRASNGQPIGYFWGYKTAGIFQNQAQIEEYKNSKHGILQSDPQPGDVIFVDVNGDGVINDDDKVNLGNGMPKFTYGFNIGFSIKGFDFTANASGSAGNKIVQSYRNQTNYKSNYTIEILERWTGEGTSNRIPRVTEANINWPFSDLYVHNGRYLRLTNLTIGYDFARLFTCKYVSQIRVYAQVQNLFTITPYDGMDPEIGYGVEDKGWVSGIDLGYYPRPRTFLFGVNLKF